MLFLKNTSRKPAVDRWLAMARKLHENENGAEGGLEKILLIAFIALPILGLLIYFRNDIATKIKSLWTSVTGSSTDLTQ
jgi:Flp pilus assembly pilin Flp